MRYSFKVQAVDLARPRTVHQSIHRADSRLQIAKTSYQSSMRQQLPLLFPDHLEISEIQQIRRPFGA
jgi:hypothetical protein